MNPDFRKSSRLEFSFVVGLDSRALRKKLGLRDFSMLFLEKCFLVFGEDSWEGVGRPVARAMPTLKVWQR